MKNVGLTPIFLTPIFFVPIFFAPIFSYWAYGDQTQRAVDKHSGIPRGTAHRAPTIILEARIVGAHGGRAGEASLHAISTFSGVLRLSTVKQGFFQDVFFIIN